MKRKKKVKFGSLRVGKKFREIPDGHGFAFRYDITKMKPKIIQGNTMNARCGKLFFSFSDGDDVLV